MGAVDEVFQNLAARGLSQDGEAPAHQAIRRNDPGLVEIWPLEEAEEREASEDWSELIDRVSASDPMMRVARRIAATVDGWRRQGATARCAGAGSKRGPFVDALTRELKRCDVPVAGSDRLAPTDHIVVKDLVVLGRFLLLAEDDLSLAAVSRARCSASTMTSCSRLQEMRGKAQSRTLGNLVKHAATDQGGLRVGTDRRDGARGRISYRCSSFLPDFSGPMVGAGSSRPAWVRKSTM